MNLLFFTFLFMLFVPSLGQTRFSAFLEMEGIRFSHSYTNPSDSLSSPEIIELRDVKGIPVWFRRDFRKVVCLTGQCRIVHLWIFWDGTGNYLGIQEHPGEPLTKTDHTFFTAADYQKLQGILADSVSVLKHLKQEELIVKTEKHKGKVDAVSSATQPSLKEYLVRNAAYTCYTLWHTVYGSTRNEIVRLLEERADDNYLKLIFEKNDPAYLRWAIDFIGRTPEYYSIFYRQLIGLIKSKDEILSQRVLNYFSKDRLSDTAIQKELILSFEDFGYQRKFELLWKFSEVQYIDNKVILHLLDMFENDRINASLLGYTYKLIRPENLEDSRIMKKLKSFAVHRNLYVRNLTRKVLEKNL
jgi:hypothetical protein